MDQNRLTTEPATDITSATHVVGAEPRNVFVSSAAAFHDILTVGTQASAGSPVVANDASPADGPEGPVTDGAVVAGEVPELTTNTDFFATAKTKQPFWRMKMALPKKRPTGRSRGGHSSKGRRPLPDA